MGNSLFQVELKKPYIYNVDLFADFVAIKTSEMYDILGASLHERVNADIVAMTRICMDELVIELERL